MGLNETPLAQRVHIGFFGRRNAGKSSLINAVTSQEIAIVSDVRGTTTDPVYKAMEILPLGPVMLIDTPGYDDEGELGKLRVAKTKQVLNKTDIVVLVVDSTGDISDVDREMISLFETKNLPYIVVFNKCDLCKEKRELKDNEICVSTLTNEGIEKLKEKIAHLKSKENEKRIVADLISPNDLVVLVTPIDASAPKGRLILPQQQTIRDILDSDAIAVVSKETELSETLSALKMSPKMVITDSQVFEKVSRIVPESVKLTSFSILMARYKGFLSDAVKGVRTLDSLSDGDIVLIAEGCTHHRQCEDIGSVKLPKWIKEHTGKDLVFEFTSGGQFPEDLSKYKVIVHCGGCMLNEREIAYRMKCARDAGVPFTNYGTVIAHIKGILSRSIEIFGDL